jgi:DNA (cytosine-5)-methyltransferase 1
MPQIHVKLDEETHRKLSQQAREFNYSIQEFAVKALQQAADNPRQNLFPSRVSPSDPDNHDFTFSDLFAGIGGIRIAFEKQGGKCVFSSESDRWCQKTYYEYFGDMPVGDINGIDIESIEKHNILTAGFPCQPFSIAGVSKKKSLGRAHGFKDQAQGTLFFRVAEILEKKRPQAFMLENVKHLRNHDGGKTFRIIKGTLDELDYEVSDDVIDAIHYVPQHRERLFIIGFDRKIFKNIPPFEFPKVTRRKKPRLGSILEKRVDSKYILSDKLWKYLQDYAEKHRMKGNGFGYGLFDENSIARTLSARYYKDGSEILIKVPNSNPRRLTPKECSRLMGFPKDFRITVSDTQAYRQFGNSVVVPVVEAVAEKLVRTLRSLMSSDSVSSRTVMQ